MFNDRYGLTRAVIDGRKTETRRVIKAPRRFKGKDVNGYWVYRHPATREVVEVCMKDYDDYEIEGGQIRPKYDFDEIVAVAQNYEDAGYECQPYRDTDEYLWLRRDGQEVNNISVTPAGVTNKLFVCADLMPHHIRITDIHIERLQDISDDDCLREGIRYIQEIDCYYFERADRDEGFYFNTPREAFAALIDKVSGCGTWDRNPYVVVYEFELVK